MKIVNQWENKYWQKMILKKIIENKRNEVNKRKKQFPLNSFKNKLKKSDRNFKDAIRNRLSLIAEVKKASPSEGIIRKNFNIKKIIRAYEKYADAISVLTDRKFFGGAIENIKKIKKITTKPILRKDFIIDPYQIYESRYYGSDAVLLIAGILSISQINYFIKISKKYNMDCLVEVHTEEELRKVLGTKAEIIGINNRNLDTLKIDMNTTLKLTEKIPKNKIIVSESGFKSKKDIEKIKNKANAVLIGASLLKAKDVEGEIKGLILPKIKICGITNEKDANKAAELGADYVGFIFYKKSPRYARPIIVKRIISKTPNVKKVGVFVNQSLNEIKKIIKYCNLDLIQLHGEETPDFCRKLKKMANKKIIKAIRIKSQYDINKIKKYNVDYFLFDAYKKGFFGGTGKTFNWKVLKRTNKNYFLSGGLSPDNVRKAVKLRPFAVDTASGVELNPRKKDYKKMKLFIERAR